nr:MAG TPA: hypothetical protein [Caudoviricetes sp.]
MKSFPKLSPSVFNPKSHKKSIVYACIYASLML